MVSLCLLIRLIGVCADRDQPEFLCSRSDSRNLEVHVATAGGWLTRYRPREVRNSIYRYRKIHIDYRSKFLYRFISPISIIYGNTTGYQLWFCTDCWAWSDELSCYKYFDVFVVFLFQTILTRNHFKSFVWQFWLFPSTDSKQQGLTYPSPPHPPSKITHSLGLLISMAWCKTAVTPVRQQWSYCSLALSHRYRIYKKTYQAHKQNDCICLSIVRTFKKTDRAIMAPHCREYPC